MNIQMNEPHGIGICDTMLEWYIGHQNSHAKIQNLCHNETNVRFEFCEQFATSSWQQFVGS
jgi:hypothetical protein